MVLVSRDGVLTESKEGLVVIDTRQNRRHDVRLADCIHAIDIAARLTGVVESDRHLVQPLGVGVFRVRELVGVVRRQHKQRMVVPRLCLGVSKELPQSVVGIADTLVNGLRALREDALVALRHTEGMVRRGREDRSHKRLLQLAHRAGVVLQELLIPDSPRAVERLLAIVLVHAVVGLEAGRAGVSLETHAAVGRSMEERGGVALTPKPLGDGRYSVGGIRRYDIRLNQHRNRGQHGGHGVDRLAPRSERIGIGGAASEQRIKEGRVALVRAAVEVVVEETDVLLGERLEDQHDHIVGTAYIRHLRRHRRMHGRHDLLQLLLGEVMRIVIGLVLERFHQREGRIEQNGRLLRGVGVLQRIGNRNRAGIATKAATDAYHHEID